MRHKLTYRANRTPEQRRRADALPKQRTMDRLTLRGIVRSLQRRAAGRWDGIPR